MADDLRRMVLTMHWCPCCGLGAPSDGDGVHDPERVVPSLWDRCPELRPAGLTWRPGPSSDLPRAAARGWYIGHDRISDAVAEAVIGWKCINWIASTNDWWEALGNALMEYGDEGRVRALISLCHRELDHRDQLKVED